MPLPARIPTLPRQAGRASRLGPYPGLLTRVTKCRRKGRGSCPKTRPGINDSEHRLTIESRNRSALDTAAAATEKAADDRGVNRVGDFGDRRQAARRGLHRVDSFAGRSSAAPPMRNQPRNARRGTPVARTPSPDMRRPISTAHWLPSRKWPRELSPRVGPASKVGSAGGPSQPVQPRSLLRSTTRWTSWLVREDGSRWIGPWPGSPRQLRSRTGRTRPCGVERSVRPGVVLFDDKQFWAAPFPISFTTDSPSRGVVLTQRDRPRRCPSQGVQMRGW